MPRVATSINISNPKRYGYDIKLDDILLRAAIGPGRDMTIQSSDVEGGQVNVKQNAEDFTSNLGRVFSRNDFSGGSNLDSAHRRDGTEKDTIRFWDSSGVDVFGKDLGNSYNISLLNTTTNLRSLSSSDADNYLAQVGTTIYVSDDATLLLARSRPNQANGSVQFINEMDQSRGNALGTTYHNDAANIFNVDANTANVSVSSGGSGTY